jgi:hypothetical protein
MCPNSFQGKIPHNSPLHIDRHSAQEEVLVLQLITTVTKDSQFSTSLACAHSNLP